jgi:N6-L-threonylcarbamoyladenine synthase
VSSQIKEHEKFGGVVPELAARAHVENIDFIINKALKDSKLSIAEIDGVAATAGPGLMVCLTVGLNIGKSIAAFANKPFVAVNHLEGHALSPGLENKIKFPYLLLLISGGHSQYLVVNNINEYEQLGTTIDDALGEALGIRVGLMLKNFQNLVIKIFINYQSLLLTEVGAIYLLQVLKLQS